jgi:ribose transport system ATP-binding protein
MTTAELSGGSRLLKIESLSKTFPGVLALDNVNLTLDAGEIIGLVGHNGSGKSTLVKILAGIHSPDAGAHIDLRSSIHFIHQDLGLIPMLNTVENLDIGRRKGFQAFAPTRRDERADAQRLISRFGASFDVTVPISKITPAECTIVALARATASWSDDRNVLVLDEPTATLHGEEAERLRAVVRQLAANGTGVIYISHHLGEIVELADRAVVMRDGKVILDAPRGEFDRERLVAAISGRVSVDPPPARPIEPKRVVKLRVRQLSAEGLDRLDLEVSSGEIVGLSGLIGSGMEQALGAIFGSRPCTGGSVEVIGRAVPRMSPKHAMKAGLAYLPSDRRRLGAVLGMSARENLTLSSLSSICSKTGAISLAREAALVERDMTAVSVRPHNPDQKFALFSGGNQQKILIAKWLMTKPSVLMFDEPTQGVDVGAQSGIYQLIRQAAADGAAVLIASTDEKELATICHRVVVISDGSVSTELVGTDVNESRIIRASRGHSARVAHYPSKSQDQTQVEIRRI